MNPSLPAESRAIGQYIDMGLFWRYLQDAQAGYLVHGEGCVVENIDRVFHRLERGLRPRSRLTRLQLNLGV